MPSAWDALRASIRRLKIFRLAKDKFRLNPKSYPIAILTVCGLVRLNLGTCF